MKVLVLGSGGREHAIVRKLKESPLLTEIYVAPGNGGIAQDATCVDLSATDLEQVVAWSQKNQIDYVVVTPDDPLVLGMVDELQKVGIAAFGPNKKAAQIEGSKVFSKNLMKKYGIPTAQYQTFSNLKDAQQYLHQQTQFPVVIKADGLALGKGVIITQTLDQGEKALQDIMEDKIFGASGSQVVIEEFLTGPEVSVLAFTDGKTIVPMVSSMDHKRAFDGNLGPNTGGMGTIAPNPHYTQAIAQECLETIFLPTIEAMNRENASFQGCLYFGLMLTSDGPKVIEYNCRFGDPETQVVLPLLQGDLLEIMLSVTQGRLAEIDFGWKEGTAACVIAASGGYPNAYRKNLLISGLELDGQYEDHSVCIYHAGTRQEEQSFYTAGGRVLGVISQESSLNKSLAKCYGVLSNINFEGIQYRKDIGQY